MAETSPNAAELLRELVGDRARILGQHGAGLEALRPFALALQNEAPALAQQLETRARSFECELHELLALDGGLVELLAGAQLERSLGLFVDGPRGSVLGGVWSLPPAQAQRVALRPIELGNDQPGWAFGLPGGLPFAGISPSGHAIVANSLRPASPGPGIPGSTRLLEVLAAPRVEQVRARIESSPLADGRNWMIADGRSFHGYEQLGEHVVLTRIGRKVSHVHTNHCFDPSLRQREARPRGPLSFRRLELASTLYIQRSPDTAQTMLEFFAEVEREAFAEPSARAECMLAVELATGLALWRNCSTGPIHSCEFATPLRTS